MVYRNGDRKALSALERMRTGFYGDEDFIICGENTVYDCPVCSAKTPRVFYINYDDECVGCSECVAESETP